MHKSVLAVASLGLLAFAPCVSAQLANAQLAGVSTFVVTSGDDTVAVERVTRTSNSLTGDLRLAGPQPQRNLHAHYVATLRPDGGASRVDVIDDMPGFFTGVLVFDGSAMAAAQHELGALNDRIRMVPPNTYPTIGTSMALMEQLIRATHPTIGASVRIGVVNIRNGNRAAVGITRTSADSVVLACDGCMQPNRIETIHLAVSKDGEIVGGTNPELQWVIVRR